MNSCNSQLLIPNFTHRKTIFVANPWSNFQSYLLTTWLAISSNLSFKKRFSNFSLNLLLLCWKLRIRRNDNEKKMNWRDKAQAYKTHTLNLHFWNNLLNTKYISVFSFILDISLVTVKITYQFGISCQFSRDL